MDTGKSPLVRPNIGDGGTKDHAPEEIAKFPVIDLYRESTCPVPSWDRSLDVLNQSVQDNQSYGLICETKKILGKYYFNTEDFRYISSLQYRPFFPYRSRVGVHHPTR
jgi:hypothetical protein